jgi:type I restriction enzyme S subunit
MKTCDLKEIIYLPSGIFTYTTIKTCVFYFVKKREGTEVLETKIKISKTQKETGRDYKFSKTHQTTKVKFYDYNPYEDVKNLLVEVSIEKISSNSYSLNYAEYMKDETEEEQYEDGVVVKTLGEVCKFDIGGTPSRSKNEYYENGNNLWVSVRELNGGYIYDTKEKITDLGVQNSSVKLFAKDTILFSFKLSIGKTAIVGNPLYTNEAIAGIFSKNNDLLNNKYLYYYLTINDFSKLGSGILGNGSLNKKSLEQIKIPIPSLERQQEIVKYLDFIYEKANKTSNEKIAELKQLNEFCLSNQKIFGENVVKTLREVCDIKCGNHSTKKCKFIEGEYLIIGGGKQPIGKHNEYNCDENTILCASHGTAGYISMYPVKTFLTMAFAFIENKQLINKIYLYYYLKSIEQHLISLGKGTAQPCISMDKLKSIKIPIPSLERQQEIVEYCENNDNLIKLLEKEIENNKKQAQQFITGIVKAQVKTEEQSDTSSVNTEPIDEVQNEIVYVEEEVIIEPKPKVKKIKKTFVIVEENNKV